MIERAQGVAQRVVDRCRELAAITDVPGETTRTYLSPAMLRCNARVREWMHKAGLTTHIDAAGNLHARSQAKGPALIIASHLDTVPNAGAFDGILGVILGLEIATACPDLPIEVIGFSEEEGVRFRAPFIGSRALVGTLDDELLSKTDHDGISVRQTIVAVGLDPEQIPAAKVGDALGYLEFHIEQGPLLEAEDHSLGVVHAIAGQSRYTLRFLGQAHHAGTTPMHLRRDAMTAAAEWILAVEALARSSNGVVATVGRVETLSGAGNVIAGEVRATLDVRSAVDEDRKRAAQDAVKAAEQIASSRSIAIKVAHEMEQPAVPMNREWTSALQTAAPDALGMVSGAGHDAMIVAPHMPSAMLFLRSPGGLSHHPDEAVRLQDIEAALHAGVRFVREVCGKQQETPCIH